MSESEHKFISPSEYGSCSLCHNSVSGLYYTWGGRDKDKHYYVCFTCNHFLGHVVYAMKTNYKWKWTDEPFWAKEEFKYVIDELHEGNYNILYAIL